MSEKKSYPFSFSGRGGEYFKIWIVNIVLTLLTLGIYSAWAKVRTKRWFYGNTWLDGHAFTYLATPMQILKGRILVIVFVVAYGVASRTMPMLALGMMLLLFIATPWLMVSALRFTARMSAYRGIRFNFVGTVKEAAVVYFVLPLLIPFTLGFILPYVAYRQLRFIANHMQFGDTAATHQGSLKPFWMLYLTIFGMLLLPVLLGIFAFSQLQTNPTLGMPLMFAAVLLFYGAMLSIGAYASARIGNLYFNHTTFGEVGFACSLRARSLMWIYFSNVVSMALTLGLFFPWARVRLARYRAQQLSLQSNQALDSFTGQGAASTGAAGAELADAFDMDVGIL